MNKEKNKSLTCERPKISAVFCKNEETFLHSPEKYSMFTQSLGYHGLETNKVVPAPSSLHR